MALGQSMAVSVLTYVLFIAQCTLSKKNSDRGSEPAHVSLEQHSCFTKMLTWKRVTSHTHVK